MRLRGTSLDSPANTSGKGVVSAILVRALLSALEGSVLEASRSHTTNHVNAVVRSHSKPETAAECWLDWSCSRCGVPHGDETKVTYHLGVLAIVQALGEPERAQDFWQVYTGLLGAFRQYGCSAEIKEPLCRAADELYFWLRFGPADADSSHSRLEALQIGPQRPTSDTSELFSMNVNPLTDPDALRALLGNDHAPEEAAPVAVNEPAVPGRFVG